MFDSKRTRPWLHGFGPTASNGQRKHRWKNWSNHRSPFVSTLRCPKPTQLEEHSTEPLTSMSPIANNRPRTPSGNSSQHTINPRISAQVAPHCAPLVRRSAFSPRFSLLLDSFWEHSCLNHCPAARYTSAVVRRCYRFLAGVCEFRAFLRVQLPLMHSSSTDEGMPLPSLSQNPCCGSELRTRRESWKNQSSTLRHSRIFKRT